MIRAARLFLSHRPPPRSWPGIGWLVLRALRSGVRLRLACWRCGLTVREARRLARLHTLTGGVA